MTYANKAMALQKALVKYRVLANHLFVIEKHRELNVSELYDPFPDGASIFFISSVIMLATNADHQVLTYASSSLPNSMILTLGAINLPHIG